MSKSSSTKLTKPEPESHKVRNYNYYEKIQQHKLDSFNGLVQTSASTQHTSSSSNNQLHYVVNSTENDMQYNNEYNHLNQFSNLISSNLTRSKKQTTPQKHNNDDYSVRSSMPSPIPHMSSLKEKSPRLQTVITRHSQARPITMQPQLAQAYQTCQPQTPMIIWDHARNCLI